MNELRSQIEAAIDGALTEEALAGMRAKISNAMSDLQSDFEYHLKSDVAYNLARHVEDMAHRAIKAMLEGDDATMRQHLHCKEGCYTGRDRDHPVIHGKLFETGAIELRKLVVNAHAELLKNERILDLEDQVKSLVLQVRKLEADNARLCRESAA